jgi:hypothetical protein
MADAEAGATMTPAHPLPPDVHARVALLLAQCGPTRTAKLLGVHMTTVDAL